MDHPLKHVIEVTADDIRRGGYAADCCPIAIAMRRRWPEALVGPTHFQVQSREGAPTYGLPDEAVNFITNHDRKLEVDPITFEVYF